MGKSAVLYEPAFMAWPRWVRDRSAIVVQTRSTPDTIIVLRPDGLELERRVFPGDPNDVPLAPCGPRRMIGARLAPGEPPTPFILELDSLSVTPVPARYPVTYGPILCSPDGAVMAYPGLVDGAIRVVLQNLSTGDTLVGPRDLGALIEWLPDGPSPPVPVAVRATPRRMELDWGGTAIPQADVQFSDSSLGAHPALRWTSLNPRVAYVGRGDLLFAVAPGTARLVADVWGWITDTITVTVRASERLEAALLSDRFHRLDPTVWYAFGEPRPVPVIVDGQPALDMKGDGIGGDGIASVPRYDLSRGATLETTFRLPLTRRDRQSIAVCLRALPEGAPPSPGSDPLGTQGLCFTHPVGESGSWDPETFGFNVRLPMGRHREPDLLRPDGWTRLAMVVAPDGEARLLLNGKEAARSLEPLAMDPSLRWQVLIHGRAADTRLLIRDVVLWEGMRY